MPSASHLLDKWEPDISSCLLSTSLTEAPVQMSPRAWPQRGQPCPLAMRPEHLLMAGTAQFITNVTVLNKPALLPPLSLVCAKTTTTALTWPLCPPPPSPAHYTHHCPLLPILTCPLHPPPWHICNLGEITTATTSTLSSAA